MSTDSWRRSIEADVELQRATQEMEAFAINFGSTATDAPMPAPARSSQETAPSTEQSQDPRQKDAPPSKKRREPEQWQNRGRGWDNKGNKWDSWGSSSQRGEKDLMYAMARLVLRHEDSLSIAASENGYMLFIKANTPASILPSLYQAGQEWKKMKEEDPSSLKLFIAGDLVSTHDPGVDQLAQEAGQSRDPQAGCRGQDVLCEQDVLLPAVGREGEEAHASERPGTHPLRYPDGGPHGTPQVGGSSVCDSALPLHQEAHGVDPIRGPPLDAPHREPGRGGSEGMGAARLVNPQRSLALNQRHGETRPHGPQCFGRSGSEDGQQAVRTLELRNPSNFCYAHSTLLALLWANTFVNAGHSVFGAALRSITDWLLRQRKPVELWSLRTWRPLRAGWTRPRQQHDAEEYLSFLNQHLNPLVTHGEWQSCYVTEGPDGHSVLNVQDRGVTWPLLLAEPIQAGLMVIQLNRFNLQGRPKNMSPVVLNEVLRMPKLSYTPCADLRQTPASSTLAAAPVQYQLRSAVLHFGETCDSGHYRSILYADSQAFATDDGVAAKPASQLFKSQVATRCYLAFYMRMPGDAS